MDEIVSECKLSVLNDLHVRFRARKVEKEKNNKQMQQKQTTKKQKVKRLIAVVQYNSYAIL